jgi:ABC-type maltose transport system permease subunit
LNTDTQENKNSVSPAIKIIAFLIFAVAIMCYPVSNFFGFSFSIGNNALEKSLHPGVSDKEQFVAFMDKGGLPYESSWKGYGVQNINVRYHDNNKLAIAEIRLWKEFSRKKLASIANLKSSLSSDCGSDWKATQSNFTMHQAKKNGIECALQDEGDYTEVVLVKRQP